MRLCLVTILVGTTLCYGAFRVSTARFHDGPRLALLQSNIEQKHKSQGRPGHDHHRVRRAGRARSLARREPPDLIVWPETSYPSASSRWTPPLDPGGPRKPGPLDSRPSWSGQGLARERTAESPTDLHPWTDRVGVPMLVGSIVYDHQTGMRSTNTIRPSCSCRIFETIHFYHKMHLVPFGEYFPLIESLPWLAALTPYRGEKSQSLSFGRKPICLPLGPYRLAVTICFEDTIPQVIRRFFAEAERRPPARRADQPVQRRLVPRLRRAGHASGDRRVPRRRESRAPGPRRQHRASRPWSTATARSAKPCPRDSKACCRSPCRSTSVQAIIPDGATGWASRAWPSRSA